MSTRTIINLFGDKFYVPSDGYPAGVRGYFAGLQHKFTTLVKAYNDTQFNSNPPILLTIKWFKEISGLEYITDSRYEEIKNGMNYIYEIDSDFGKLMLTIKPHKTFEAGEEERTLALEDFLIEIEE